MDEAFPRGRTAIVGAATYGSGDARGEPVIDMTARAALLALADAGMTPADVDGLFVTLPEDMFGVMSFAEYLGIDPRMVESTRSGGSGFLIHALWAALALDAGMCDVVLIAYGSNQRSAAGKLVRSPSTPFPYESDYRPINPVTGYALAAARHMHQYGTTREQLADVAVAARGWANLNPEAFARGPLTRGDVLGSRMVVDPLTVRDCCLVTDGAAAVVMTRADRARYTPGRPAYLLGGGQAVSHRNISAMPDLTVTAAVRSGARAYAAAGLGASEIDAAQIYDAFTINTILFLEDLGFCPKGEGGRFVADGRIAPGGALAVNTNGGGLSCTHPGMYGLFLMVEAARQIRRTAGERQLATADTILTHGNGGVLSSQATLIFGSAAAL